jgi:hypothetical protein
MTDVSAIVPRATVEAIVRAYSTAEETIEASCAAIAGAVRDVNTTLGSLGFTREFEFGRVQHGQRVEFEEPDEHIHQMRRQLWSSLVERLEIRRMVSIARAKELNKWLDTTTEAVTYESVMGLFRNYVEQLPDMLAEAVGEVYEFVRPRMSKLKTNTQYELGPKVILSGWVDGSFMGGLRPNYHRADEYRALENVFTALDGKGQITKSYRGELGDAVEKSSRENDYRGETTYFRFRACKNGNLHLEFKRADLVAKFNQMAGGRRLKHDVDARRQGPEARPVACDLDS